jgi:REP element-mobilizing transposase RayT
MARSLRLDYLETFYHVLSRGNEKREIFRDQKDYPRFLEDMGKMVGRFKLEIHAYVLMGNHYHLLLRTKEQISPVASSGWGSARPSGSIAGMGEADICFRGVSRTF